ncbi:MAG: carboxylating nicotinate-nucleotide diphosphorylase [Candidatus Aminicenantes bacterium]|nr:carboxylating nicotinate-nucleotide diphosphorylase [Candidatus Aminicenantes bacterium]
MKKTAWLDAADRVITAALREDAPKGDITSQSLLPPGLLARAVLMAKQDGVLAGLEVAARVFRRVDPRVSFNRLLKDGDRFRPGDILAEVEGKAAGLLLAERTALNFLQRLSGIATVTRRYADVLAGTKTRLLDTRKTTPGLRVLEKQAVAAGGGVNHRMGLSDMVLIKDNHLLLVPGIADAVARARRKVGRGMKIEVEVTSFAQAREAVEAGADRIMLDNVSIAAMRKITAWVAGRVPIEVSGNVDLKRLPAIAALGVAFVSIGRLTHSAAAADISLELIGPLGRDEPRVPLDGLERRLREKVDHGRG